MLKRKAEVTASRLGKAHDQQTCADISGGTVVQFWDIVKRAKPHHHFARPGQIPEEKRTPGLCLIFLSELVPSSGRAS